MLHLMRRSTSERLRSLSLIAAIAALASCSTEGGSPSTLPMEREEAEVRELVFRDLLKGESPGAVCFIAIGAARNKWIDPPEGFLERLAIPQLTLRKVSEARFPKKGEMDPEDSDRYQGVRDPRTGNRCYVYSVKIESLTPQRAKVRAEFFSGPLSGGGYESSVVRENGRWVIKFDGERWAN